MAGNDTEGLRYGVVETPEKHWLRWKEADAHPAAGDNPLLRELGQLCARERLLEIVHDFMVFDAGVKKTCRHNQYFGVRAAQARIRRREGGIVWHTQGSGKSLTMVWLAKWIREHVTGGRVLIVTDRTELDEQIERVFKGVGEADSPHPERRRSRAGARRRRRMADRLADPQVRHGGGRRRRRLRQGPPRPPARGVPRQGPDVRLRGRVPPHPVREAPRGDEGAAAGRDADRLHGHAAAEETTSSAASRPSGRTSTPTSTTRR